MKNWLLLNDPFHIFQVLIIICNIVMASPSCIDGGNKGVAQTFSVLNKSELEKSYIALPKRIINSSALCRLNIVVKYQMSFVDLNVKFGAYNFLLENETNRLLLSNTISLDEHALNFDIDLICDRDLCNRDYFYSFLIAGQLDWLFTLREKLDAAENMFLQELYSFKDKVLDDHVERKQSVMCYDDDDDSEAIPCRDQICSFYTTFDAQAYFSCGAQDVDLDDEHVQIQYKITPASSQAPLFKYAFACNKNKCNGNKTATKIKQYITKHYNLSHWIKSTNVFPSETVYESSTNGISTADSETDAISIANSAANVLNGTLSPSTGKVPSSGIESQFDGSLALIMVTRILMAYTVINSLLSWDIDWILYVGSSGQHATYCRSSIMSIENLSNSFLQTAWIV